MASSAPAVRDRTRYQGKNLALLLLAMGLPAAMLYLRILLGTIVGYTHHMSPPELNRLTLLSNAALVAFFVVQLACAVYIQRLVPPRRSPVGRFLQYLAVLALCVVLSITGAVLFEGFGVAILMRAGRL